MATVHAFSTCKHSVIDHECSPEGEAEFTIFTVGPKINNPITVTLQINECPLDMEVDTDATCP